MKRIGLIGGIGPESTIEYYRRLIDAHRRRTGAASPPLLIDSLDVDVVVAFASAGRLAELAEYLGGALDRLAGGGAGIAAIGSNTSHVAFDRLRDRSPIPLVSIIEATAAAARRSGLRRLLLLGTTFTMEGAFYRPPFDEAGIALILPEKDDRAWVHGVYMGELLRGVVRPETLERMTAIVSRGKREAGIDGAILGGTELSLLFREPAAGGVPLLDTTQIHVEALLDAAADAGHAAA